ncbi:MAG TPA: 5-methyltetrahydropteroyltriglutamate--homocysteine S-methyltransferase [Fibrobacteres bacterium]|nr:5-methyltetrahydropteroyltriglutamate--homocysteine S-methyltransferase [Fibrobacterota bacterium]
MNIKTSITGFPRIGKNRKLKFALEKFWSGEIDKNELDSISEKLMHEHWTLQKNAGVDLISINDFSLYDSMLDTAVMLGAIPQRFRNIPDETKRYFAMARGTSGCPAMAMRKWFNTNYHYIVPELSITDDYRLNDNKIVYEYCRTADAGFIPKVNIIGPVTFIALSKFINSAVKHANMLQRILPVYKELFVRIAKLCHGNAYIQLEEPFFAGNVSPEFLSMLETVCKELINPVPGQKVIFCTYFGHSCEANRIIADSGVYGVSLDFINGPANMDTLPLMSGKKIVAGVVNGRNVWKTDIKKSLNILSEINRHIPKDDIIVGTSCSLLHVPFTISDENHLSDAVRPQLSFACEKITEVVYLSKKFHAAEEYNAVFTEVDVPPLQSVSSPVNVFESTDADLPSRSMEYKDRIVIQNKTLKLPLLPTTTIGSFPQTAELRKTRSDFKKGAINRAAYEKKMRDYIDECIDFQEQAGIDVFVHGEPERNDMVEYFGENLDGFIITDNGWVQSYGSRCVKPPVIFGDVSRPQPITLAWITYAQTRTNKPVKGMLTGPVTIINWSFVREDIPRAQIARQIASALSKEIIDLQNSGIKIIQVDEAAFKEGYPLRAIDIAEYEKWAIESFRLMTSVARPETQIHTHMCYSRFDDIMYTLKKMDADVITIETARSGNELLSVFKTYNYDHDIGPGVYDIHSPRVPTIEEFEKQIITRLKILDLERLWINPDCGLKTRTWDEVKPALENMVIAAKNIRKMVAAHN